MSRPSLNELMADKEGLLAAVRRATRAAVLDHARSGHPVATWRDGRVVWISPEEILARFNSTAGEPALKPSLS